MRERPRQRRQSLSRPATTQFIPHVPQDSPRSDLRNVFYFPAPSLRHRARSGRCGCCTAPPPNGRRLRLSLHGCIRPARPAAFRTVSRSTIGTSSLPDPIAAAGHLHTRLPRHLPTSAHRIHHRAHKKETEKPKLLRPQIVCIMRHALPVSVPPQGYFHTGLTAGLRTNCSTTATDPCDPDGSRVHTTSP